MELAKPVISLYASNKVNPFTKAAASISNVGRSALIVPNFESLQNYLKSLNNSLSEPNAIIEHEDTLKLFENEVHKAMQDFANYEKVKKFELLSDLFSIEKGELTPKMSIKRKVVIEKHKAEIEAMYNSKDLPKVATDDEGQLFG